ncbi:MAG: HPr family phosphocarrier protein [Endomicrobium sp.]|jgi:phosphocarrier protein|nr:HPr family phosphocarrier protein [Endomicrobium sp.]
MIEVNITISNKMGLHIRAASLFVQAVTKYKSIIKIIKNNFEIDGKSIISIILLGVECGCKLKFIIDGPDETEVLSTIKNLFSSKENSKI